MLFAVTTANVLKSVGRLTEQQKVTLLTAARTECGWQSGSLAPSKKALGLTSLIQGKCYEGNTIHISGTSRAFGRACVSVRPYVGHVSRDRAAIVASERNGR